MRFVDTDVLLYAISDAREDAAKADRANEILAAGALGVSAQVLQEFYVQATRATRPNPLSHQQAFGLVEAFARFPVQQVDARLVLSATGSAKRFRISYWDAAVLEAARALGCEVVVSEDLSHGQDYDGVRVENPFRGL